MSISSILVPSSLISSLSSCDSVLKVHQDRVSIIVFAIGHFLSFDQGGTSSYYGEQYVGINASKLKKLSPDYKKIIDWLEENEIIEVYKSYTVGYNPCSYRFSTQILQDEFVTVELTDHRSITALNKLIKDSLKPLSSKYPALRKWVLKEELNISDELKVDQLNKVFQETLDEGVDEESSYLYNLANNYKIHYIGCGRLWFFVDDFGNRIHTNLTNLHHTIRIGYRYGDKQLVEIDIKNSQPYFMLKGLLSNYDSAIPDDVLRFKQLVLSGDLYLDFIDSLQEFKGERILEEISKSQNNKVYYSGKFKFGSRNYRDIRNPVLPIVNYHEIAPRKAGKSLMFKIMFGKHNLKSPEKQVFSSVFPSVWAYMGSVKAENYKDLAKALQREESSVVLDVICKRISKERRSLPIFTIHDCIITLKGDEDYVENIMQEELTNFVGEQPSLRLENYL